jgi:hypothetical protein
MITLLSTIFGVISSLLPNIIKIFEKKLDYKHEIDLTKIKMDAAREGLILQLQIEEIKADALEGESVRKHDSDIEYTGFWAALRASIRPTITYAFFLVFVGIKIAAFWVLVERGTPTADLLLVIWDGETMAIFSAIIGFWFGSRAIEKFTKYSASNNSIPTLVPVGTISPVSKTVAATKKVVKKRPVGTGRDK